MRLGLRVDEWLLDLGKGKGKGEGDQSSVAGAKYTRASPLVHSITHFIQS